MCSGLRSVERGWGQGIICVGSFHKVLDGGLGELAKPVGQ